MPSFGWFRAYEVAQPEIWLPVLIFVALELLLRILLSYSDVRCLNRTSLKFQNISTVNGVPFEKSASVIQNRSSFRLDDQRRLPCSKLIVAGF